MCLFLAMIGLGYYIASALVSIVKRASNGHWYPDNLNNGSLEYYMFLLAGLMMVNAAVFLLLAVRYIDMLIMNVKGRRILLKTAPWEKLSRWIFLCHMLLFADLHSGIVSLEKSAISPLHWSHFYLFSIERVGPLFLELLPRASLRHDTQKQRKPT